MNRRVHGLRRKLRQFEQSINFASKEIKARGDAIDALRCENNRLNQRLLNAQKQTESDSRLIDSMSRHIDTLEQVVASQRDTIEMKKPERGIGGGGQA